MLDIRLASLAADFQLRRTKLIMHHFHRRERWHPLVDAGYYPQEFYQHEGPKLPVAKEGLQPLLASADFRVRLLTYSVFGNRLPKAWCDAFLVEARSMVQAPPEAELTALLARLDDDVYIVREQATEELKRYGERVVGVLRKAVAESSSPEVRRRARSLLDVLDPQLELSDWPTLLDYVAGLRTEPAHTALQVLATGDSHFRLARLASNALR
jgi:hypothetical protein